MLQKSIQEILHDKRVSHGGDSIRTIGEILDEINEIHLKKEREHRLRFLKDELRQVIYETLLLHDVEHTLDIISFNGILNEKGEIHGKTLKTIKEVCSKLFVDRTLVRVTEFVDFLERIAKKEMALVE